ncbi:MAG TPA: hypothetical protein VM369_11405, partial [Candidatus Binatia bacterium]|nr:hypothetical protein [Candidatus Binatia bacterium]
MTKAVPDPRAPWLEKIVRRLLVADGGIRCFRYRAAVGGPKRGGGCASCALSGAGFAGTLRFSPGTG